jgi:hypothetical protein
MYIQHLDLFLQHTDENTCNICVIQMKILEHILETNMYSHCNVYNIPVYFCNTDTKHLQYTSKTSEIYVCNTHFQRHISLMLGNGGLSRYEVYRCRAHR